MPLERILARSRDAAGGPDGSGGAESPGGSGSSGSTGAGSPLRRSLRARDMVGFGVGIIIGTGIFTLAGVEAQQHAGPAVTLSFLIGAVVAGLAAICYAELASSVPTAGSAYTYAFATLGETVAWIIGWDLLLEFGLGLAVVSRSWSGYLAELFGLPSAWFGEDATINVGAVAIIAVLTVVAVAGIRESARLTNVLVLVKLAVCLLILAVGAFYVNPANLTPFIPPARPAEDGGTVFTQPIVSGVFGLEPTVYGVGGMLTAAAVVFFAYTGFEALANLGEEVRRPNRDLKIGLLGALAICAVLYVGVSIVLTGMVPYTEIDTGAPLAAAFSSVGLPWVGALIAIGAVTGLTSVMMVELVTIGRIGFAMGRDGLLPEKIGTAHPRWGTPHRMTIIGGVVCAAIAAVTPITALADMVSIGALAAMIVVAVAVPILRRTRPDLERPFRVPFSPVVPALTALACLYLMLNLNLDTWIRFVGWLLLGLLVYVFYGRKHSFLAEERVTDTR
ncbi:MULTISPECIES: APC family permease [Pseudonocardia]|uniref:Amino acid permease n=2 Tax=Pseudonocardia TaxID=1847 RepID=A0ABQ0RXL9_9PSEU|nr:MULTISPECIES: amino acid permease [Pseudonocardia]OSY36131.1 putative amino acid permease YhdG [Pseudonocardia autotrophica]TDN77613.1 APA family basic amino acid/polyamine antiporter [Pseudonocardia autotrophica]BBG01643.1 amino acid permease [Pseudonocardia autotrophica]GEC25388.1 amino acid permease [Pseudonocardia saturnea]